MKWLTRKLRRLFVREVATVEFTDEEKQLIREGTPVVYTKVQQGLLRKAMEEPEATP